MGLRKYIENLYVAGTITGDGNISLPSLTAEEDMQYKLSNDTISNSEIDYNSPYMRVSPDGTDDTINKINGGSTGSILVLQTEGSQISVVHSNDIRLDGQTTFTTSDNDDTITFTEILMIGGTKSVGVSITNDYI